MPSQERAQRRKGSRKAVLARRRYVPVPNFFFDALMPRVSPHMFTVLLFLWRKTVGWGRWEDWISLSQMQKATGLCRDTVLDALALWVRTGLVRRLGRRGIRGVIAYAPNVYYDEADVLQRLAALVGETNRSKESHSTGRNLPTSPVEGIDTQEETNKNKPEEETAPPAPSVKERSLLHIEIREMKSEIKRLAQHEARCNNPGERERMRKRRLELEACVAPADAVFCASLAAPSASSG